METNESEGGCAIVIGVSTTLLRARAEEASRGMKCPCIVCDVVRDPVYGISVLALWVVDDKTGEITLNARDIRTQRGAKKFFASFDTVHRMCNHIVPGGCNVQLRDMTNGYERGHTLPLTFDESVSLEEAGLSIELVEPTHTQH